MTRICRVCMGEDSYELKTVEIPVHVGTNTALVTVEALEYSQCGNQLIDEAMATRLEAAFDQLRVGDTAGMEAVGMVYRLRQ